jgi:hypothetical protein
MQSTLILSWDVGIKHLAYNLSEYCEDVENTENKIKLVIKQWGIINLALEQCSFCEKDGQYLFNNEIGDNKYYCIDHCKKLRAKHFCYVEKCYEKAKYNIDTPDNNKYICDTPGPKVYGFDNSTEILKKKLIEKLDLIQFGEYKYVLIENQPTFKNPKMKAIADTLYAWFLIRKIIDEKILLSENIRLISPSRKNTLFGEKKTAIKEKNQNSDTLSPDILPLDTEPTRSLQYRDAKKLSIEFCKKIITPEWCNYLNEFTKKDDLADCLLQGYSFYYLLINENNKKQKKLNKKLTKK